MKSFFSGVVAGTDLRLPLVVTLGRMEFKLVGGNKLIT